MIIIVLLKIIMTIIIIIILIIFLLLIIIYDNNKLNFTNSLSRFKFVWRIYSLELILLISLYIKK